MARYEKIFDKVLNEAGNSPVQDVPSDSAVFNNALDANTAPETFNVEPSMPGYASKYMGKAKEWNRKIKEFADWVNGTEADSLNKQFNDLDVQGSPFEGISKNSSTLTKIAEDLSSLVQTINGHILSADRRERQVAQQGTEKQPQ